MVQNPLCAVDDFEDISPEMSAFQHPQPRKEPEGSFLLPGMKFLNPTEASDTLDRLFYRDGRRAQKAGRVPKADPLNKLILQFVRRNRDISEKELLKALHRHWQDGGETVTNLDEKYIYFKLPNGNEKKAPLSGLKDRLRRAKKIIRASSARAKS